MDPTQLHQRVRDLADLLQGAADQANTLATDLVPAAGGAAATHQPFVVLFSVFVLACFIGYHVVWRVTPALHSPLMAVTNAISSVIIVGALIAAGSPGTLPFSELMASSPSRWRPSTSSAASWSRTACSRCSRRSRNRRTGAQLEPGPRRPSLSRRLRLLHHGPEGLSSPQTSRAGNLYGMAAW